MRCSTSSGVMPGAFRISLTWVGEMSGKASIGSCRQAAMPAPTPSAVTSSTTRRCASANSIQPLTASVRAPAGPAPSAPPRRASPPWHPPAGPAPRRRVAVAAEDAPPAAAESRRPPPGTPAPGRRRGSTAAAGTRRAAAGGVSSISISSVWPAASPAAGSSARSSAARLAGSSTPPTAITRPAGSAAGQAHRLPGAQAPDQGRRQLRLGPQAIAAQQQRGGGAGRDRLAQTQLALVHRARSRRQQPVGGRLAGDLGGAGEQLPAGAELGLRRHQRRLALLCLACRHDALGQQRRIARRLLARPGRAAPARSRWAARAARYSALCSSTSACPACIASPSCASRRVTTPPKGTTTARAALPGRVSVAGRRAATSTVAGAAGRVSTPSAAACSGLTPMSAASAGRMRPNRTARARTRAAHRSFRWRDWRAVSDPRLWKRLTGRGKTLFAAC